MKKNYRTKKIWLNLERTKYCIVKLFEKDADMQKYFVEHQKRYYDESDHASPDDVKNLGGASLHYCRSNKPDETGIVILDVNDCGAGVVSHEFMHAVLWARGHHHEGKQQYPIVIENMEQEEELLHNHSEAVRQFYNWYWKVVDET